MTNYPISDDKLPLFTLTPFTANLDWTLGVPTHSYPVTAFSVDARGAPYQLPFKCVYKHGAWHNHTTKNRLDAKIEGFR